MPAYYIYLISSLPMLSFGANPRLSFAKFLQTCAEFIPQSALQILKTVSISGEYDYARAKHPSLRKWFRFDTALRNELVHIRAGRRHLEPEKYLRQDGFAEPSIAHIVLAALRHPAILEAERMLDEARWAALDELAQGHYYDLDFLIVYALKLLLLERWQRIDSADKEKLLEEILQQA